MARESMTGMKAEYGVENPKYKAVAEQLEQAQEDYDNKVDGIVAGIRTRVEQDANYLLDYRTGGTADQGQKEPAGRGVPTVLSTQG